MLAGRPERPIKQVQAFQIVEDHVEAVWNGPTIKIASSEQIEIIERQEAIAKPSNIPDSSDAEQ